jgi:DNA processing protein
MSDIVPNQFVAETPDEYSADSARRNFALRNAALRLQMVQGIGPRIYGELVDRFGSAEAVLSASPSDIRSIPGVGAKLSNNIALASDIDIEPLLDCCQGHGITILQRGAEGYSKRLEEIYDPPAILFGKGTVLPCDELAIAIVGTRHASAYGIKVADQLARGLALAGLTIVSGLARGIDAAAHRGALAVGGRTIAVLGGGLLKMYPPEHQSLADEVSQSGAVLSESLPQQAPKSGSFPRRNRIVTGLSLGVIVVEAADRSGALISARLANEQGREVFSVPGRMTDRMSKGTNALIRDGATMVQSVDDVLEQLGPMPSAAKIETSSGESLTIRSPAELKLNEQETLVLQLVSEDATEIDWLIQHSELPAARVLSTVSVLEMRRLVRRVSGTAIVRI